MPNITYEQERNLQYFSSTSKKVDKTDRFEEKKFYKMNSQIWIHEHKKNLLHFDVPFIQSNYVHAHSGTSCAYEIKPYEIFKISVLTFSSNLVRSSNIKSVLVINPFSNRNRNYIKTLLFLVELE